MESCRREKKRRGLVKTGRSFGLDQSTLAKCRFMNTDRRKASSFSHQHVGMIISRHWKREVETQSPPVAASLCPPANQRRATQLSLPVACFLNPAIHHPSANTAKHGPRRNGMLGMHLMTVQIRRAGSRIEEDRCGVPMGRRV